jgi:hypothetical protein
MQYYVQAASIYARCRIKTWTHADEIAAGHSDMQSSTSFRHKLFYIILNLNLNATRLDIN